MNKFIISINSNIIFLILLLLCFTHVSTAVECNAANEAFIVNIYSSKTQQTIKGWGGNIYPSSMELGYDFLDQMFNDLPSQYMRVFSEFPKISDVNEHSFLKYLNRKKINIILNFRLSSYVLEVDNLAYKLADYISNLNKLGIVIQYISLNEPDGIIKTSIQFNDYIQLVKRIKMELTIRKLSTKFIGPNTATPNFGFINKIIDSELLNEFDVLTYHSYEYKGTDGFAKIVTIANKYNKPIWISEQNPQVDNKRIGSKQYALNCMRNLFLGLNKGRAEVSMFFSYSWGRNGGVVLFDKDLKTKPVFYELQKLYKNVPVGSKVLLTESKIPAIAFKTINGILLFIINEKDSPINVTIKINDAEVVKTIEPINIGMYFL